MFGSIEIRTVYVGAKQAKAAVISRLSNERAGTRSEHRGQLGDQLGGDALSQRAEFLSEGGEQGQRAEHQARERCTRSEHRAPDWRVGPWARGRGSCQRVGHKVRGRGTRREGWH
jgi:hypothetical protein